MSKSNAKRNSARRQRRQQLRVRDTEERLKSIRDEAAAASAAAAGLRHFDLDLIGWVAMAAHRHGSGDLIEDVFTMPATARRKLDELIAGIYGCHVVGGVEAMDPAERHRLIARLHDEVRRNNRGPDVADAFVMSPKEWRARYAPGMAQA